MIYDKVMKYFDLGVCCYFLSLIFHSCSVVGIFLLRASWARPSVHHLSTTFIENAMEATKTAFELTDEDIDASEARIYHVVDAFVKPIGLEVICPRDGFRGAAYVDTLSGVDVVGVANSLLSYSWGYKVRLFVYVHFFFCGRRGGSGGGNIMN